MGLFDFVKDIGKSVVGGIGGGILNLGGKFLEDQLVNDPNSADAYSRQKDFYRNRYQWMMQDMRKAGLNPILAAGSAGFSTSGTPTVQMSQQPVTDLTASAKNLSEVSLLEEQSKTEQQRQLKTLAETKTEIQKRFLTRAQAGLVAEQERQIWFNIEKMQSEIYKNYREGLKSMKDMELMQQHIKQIAVELQRLKNVNAIYSNPASMALSVIREIANSLGLNVGIVAPIKGK